MSAIISLIATILSLRKNPEGGETTNDEEIRGKFLADAIKWVEDRKRERDEYKKNCRKKWEKWKTQEKLYKERATTTNPILRFLWLCFCPHCGGIAVNYAKFTEKTWIDGSEYAPVVAKSRHRKYDCRSCGKVELNIYYSADVIYPEEERSSIRYYFSPYANKKFTREYKEIIINNTYMIISDNKKKIMRYKKEGKWWMLQK